MFLSEGMKNEIRKIFEGKAYYGRSLKDSEIQEIADNLVSFSETMIDFIKRREKTIKGKVDKKMQTVI